MESLSVSQIRSFFIRAYFAVREQREKVNRINLFPVPDQDTGSNLEKTLKGIYDAVQGKQFKTFKELSDAVLDGALEKASGNIGIIYTGFLSGFLPALHGSIIRQTQLTAAFKNGAKKARSSIQAPLEGTVLDVIDAVSNIQTHEINGDIILFFENVLICADKAVQNTSGKMKHYKKRSVIDAGAYGFYLTLDGFLKALKENGDEKLFAVHHAQTKQKKHVVSITQNKFEVIALIQSPTVHKAQILQLLAPFGDCIDIVEVNQKIKVHMHTDVPEKVMALIEPLGIILQLRTYDMTKGEKNENEDSMAKLPIGIVTDSASDLPKKLVEMYDVEVVPIGIYSNDKKIQEDLSQNANLYILMERFAREKQYTVFHTSQPSPGLFLKAYKTQLKKYHSVLCITLSSFLSGTYNSALQGRELLSDAEKKRVFVVDSRNGSGGQGMLVLQAIEHIGKNRGIETLVSQLQEVRETIQMFGTGLDLKWIQAGGRLSAVQGALLSFLTKIKIRPILGLKNYKIGLLGLRTAFETVPESLYKECISRISHRVIHPHKVTIIISHSNKKEEAMKLQSMLHKKGFKIHMIVELSYPLGAHLGPGVLFCSFLVQ